MLKKLLFVAAAAAILLAATGPADAAARAYYGAVVQVGQASFGNNVWVRTYDPAYDNPAKNPTGGSASCASSGTVVGFDAATRSCQLKWSSAGAGGGGYRGINDDIFNSTGTEGLRGVVFDATTGTGASRAGYYFAAAGNVAVGQPASNFTALNCAGAVAATCLGMGQNDNAAGFSISNAPVALDTAGGFRPIPVPLVNTSNRDTGDMTLVWRAASTFGSGQLAITYDLVGVAKDTCSPPASEAEYTVALGNFDATSAVINTNAFGAGPLDPKCYYFALRLVYPPAGSVAVKSRFLSANSPGVAFGGIAASVTGITARAAGGQGVAVAWQTSLEDGVKGFYVTRSIGSATGTYERVSGLITAKGQPSSYTYVDSTVPVGQVRAKGVYYKIDTVDVDDQIQSFGPAKAELTTGRPPKEGQQLRQKPVTSR